MWRSRAILCCLCVSFIFKCDAQQYGFAVSFSDKHGTGSISSPLAFLSQRSIDRRNTQHLLVDSTDLPVRQQYIDSVLQLTGGVLHVVSKWLNLCVILVPDSSTIVNLRSQSFITNVKWVGYYSATQHLKTTPTGKTTAEMNTLQAAKTTGSSGYYGLTYSQTALVHGDYLHDQGYKGEGKLIAVLDEGFVHADIHPGLYNMRQSGQMVDQHDFVYKTSNVYSYADHGFGCLSTMAGNTPGHYVGSAPNAEYALYVTENLINDQPIELYSLLAGTERADSVGADIISASIGYDLFDPPMNGASFVFARDFDGRTTVAAKAANYATSKGMLFVATAGNDAGFPGWTGQILTPGDADSALTIGNVDLTETVDASSGLGPNVAGVMKPDVCGMGVDAYVLYQDSIYGTATGTSLSTPQIAGWAACLWQAYPGATPYMIRHAIDQSADHYNNPGPSIGKFGLGYGVPNFQTAMQILSVTNPPDPYKTNWISVIPNPAKDVLHLFVNSQTAETFSFVLSDLNGKVVGNSKSQVSAGLKMNIDLPIPNIPSGIYMLHAVGSRQEQVIKVVKD